MRCWGRRRRASGVSWRSRARSHPEEPDVLLSRPPSLPGHRAGRGGGRRLRPAAGRLGDGGRGGRGHAAGRGRGARPGRRAHHRPGRAGGRGRRLRPPGAPHPAGRAPAGLGRRRRRPGAIREPARHRRLHARPGAQHQRPVPGARRGGHRLLDAQRGARDPGRPGHRRRRRALDRPGPGDAGARADPAGVHRLPRPVRRRHAQRRRHRRHHPAGRHAGRQRARAGGRHRPGRAGQLLAGPQPGAVRGGAGQPRAAGDRGPGDDPAGAGAHPRPDVPAVLLGPGHLPGRPAAGAGRGPVQRRWRGRSSAPPPTTAGSSSSTRRSTTPTPRRTTRR